MVMNGVAVDNAVEGDAGLARDHAVGYFVKIGYALVDRTDERVHLKFTGSWFTTDPEKHTHHAYVSARDGVLHFELTTGIVASYWTESDRKMADERAEHAVQAARRAMGGGYRDPMGEDPPMHACPFCGKINLVSAPACTVCGAATKR